MPRSGTELPPERPDPSALRARAATLRQHARHFTGDKFGDQLRTGVGYGSTRLQFGSGETVRVITDPNQGGTPPAPRPIPFP